MQPVCTPVLLGKRLPRSPALPAKWITAFVAHALLTGMLSVFLAPAAFADDSPSGLFGDEVELRSSLSGTGARAKKNVPSLSRSSSPASEQRHMEKRQAATPSASSIPAPPVSYVPRVGITLPQPMYQIVEPKPLYEGVAPEVPGQKHVPQSSSVLTTVPINRSSVVPESPSVKIKVPHTPLDQRPRTLRSTDPESYPPGSRGASHANASTKPNPVMVRESEPSSGDAPSATNKPKSEALKRIQGQFQGRNVDGVAKDLRPSLTPDTHLNTVRASDLYLGIAESGGWPSLPDQAVLSPGARNPTVALLKKRLMISGDLSEKDAKGDIFDAALEQAVRNFQMRHGLPQTGTVSGTTVSEMNVSARMRYRQIKGTAERLARRQFGFGERYIVVNIAAAMVEVVEEGRVQHRYRAIVGTNERQTPLLESQITGVSLNPNWTAPPTVIKEDLIPKLQKNPQALLKSGIRIFDGKGQEVDPSTIDWKTPKAASLIFRQGPGSSNPLGRIRLDMPSPQAVYLHDTPARRLFAQDERLFSSGCVRVADIRHLSSWILGPQSGYTPRSLQGLIASGLAHDLRLPQPVPVIFTYMTGYASEDGQVNFRPDVYGLDERTLTNAQAE
jgi:L,D-transpeptidase YcbB